VTTIAWDGKRMAADSGVYAGESIVRKMKKIQRMPDGALAGFCGDVEQAVALMDWIRAGTTGRKPLSRDVGILLVRPNGHIWHYDGGRRAHRITAPYYAIGNGADIAHGALFTKRDALNAVRAAAKFSVYTRGPFHMETL
jgi:ATP-dependent protease HslVU (ClpYQ) peptidase subunit